MLQGRIFGIIITLFSIFAFTDAVKAQPVLPDITAYSDNGIILISWMCQYDGVKSIAVLRSNDKNYNYSTIGYVKKLYKGAQAYADGHPMPGMNYYKLNIVFNSGLTWTSYSYGIEVDSADIINQKNIPSNDVLQKLIVIDQLDKSAKPETTATTKKTAVAEKDKAKYTEVFKAKDTTTKTKPIKTSTDANETVTYVETIEPTAPPKKLVLNHAEIDTEEIDPTVYFDKTKNNNASKPKNLSIKFDDKATASEYIENLPKNEEKKITISYTLDDGDIDPNQYLETSPQKTTSTNPDKNTPKKITLTFKDEDAAQAYMDSIPTKKVSNLTVSVKPEQKIEPSTTTNTVVAMNKPKIVLKHIDEEPLNSADIKSKYIVVDPNNGHIKMSFPTDVKGNQYAIRFYDKENKLTIEVPKVNASQIILDKRNFQKKGTYKFIIKKDGLEVESGYITLF